MPEKEITSHRDLRKASPYWETTPRIGVRTAKHLTSQHYDIIIVGAGISGALVASALNDGKKRLAIIDRRAPVLGSSMASTTMIQHEIDMPLFKLTRALGQKTAERIWLRSAKAVQSLITLIQKNDISCAMQPKKALYLAGAAYGHRALKQEADARKAIGLTANLLDAHDLKIRFNIDRTAAIESTVSASANPAQMTAGLLRGVQKQGAEIIQDMEITDFISLNDKVVLATSDGSLLTARFVVFCTGYEFLKALTHKDHTIISTWALASTPHTAVPPWLHDYLVWEASDPYLYLRLADKNRFIAGGEDEHSSTAYLDSDTLEDKARTIAEKVSALMHIKPLKVAHKWAAAFGATSLGIPMIGELPKHPHVFAAMGYGGNGITFSQIAAEIIAAAINGKDDPDADLFPFR